MSDPERHARAWLLLDAALAIHVVDEALTGSDFYNPLVRQLRDRLSLLADANVQVWSVAVGIGGRCGVSWRCSRRLFAGAQRARVS